MASIKFSVSSQSQAREESSSWHRTIETNIEKYTNITRDGDAMSKNDNKSSKMELLSIEQNVQKLMKNPVVNTKYDSVELALKENVTTKYSFRKFRNLKLENDRLFLNNCKPDWQNLGIVSPIRNHNNVSENNIPNNNYLLSTRVTEASIADKTEQQTDKEGIQLNNEQEDECQNDPHEIDSSANNSTNLEPRDCIMPVDGDKNEKEGESNEYNEDLTHIRDNFVVMADAKHTTENESNAELKKTRTRPPIAYSENSTQNNFIDTNEIRGNQHHKNNNNNKANEVQAFIKLPDDNDTLLAEENKVEKTCSEILMHIDNDQEYKMPSREEKTFIETLKNTKSSRQQLTVLADAINATPDLIRSCIKEIGIYEHRLTEPDIKVLSQTVLLCSKLEELALRSCKMNPKHLELLLEQTRNTKCKIKKFTVSNIDGIESLVSSICKSLSVYKSEILCIENDELEDDVVNKLEKCLADEKITHMNELDVSYNKNISKVAYNTMGKILRKCGSKTFKAVDCDLDSKKLKEFSEGLGAAELDELDVSCNEDMKDEAFETIAGLVGTNKVKHLKLSSCGLTKRRFNRFRRFNSDKAKLFELDVSYNPFMNRRTFKALGKTVKQYQVEKLSLAGCKLGRVQVKLFRIFVGEHQMDAMDVRDNFRIGEGIIEIANIVVDCKLKDLDISECMLSPYQVRRFKKALGYGKLRCLNLSDKERVATESHIRAICELLPNIYEELHVRFNKFDESLKSILQEELNNLPKTDMKIILNDGCMKQQKHD